MRARRRARLAGACALVLGLALGLAGCAAPPQEADSPAPPTPALTGPAPPVSVPVAPSAPAGVRAPAPQAVPPDAAAAEDMAEEPAAPLLDEGLASWYGPGLHGRRTASGERFDRFGFTAAHRTLPFGTRVCVRSLVTGKTVMVRINDRGPFGGGERVVDLSQAAARELGMIGLGIKPVQLWQADEGDTGCTPALGDEAARAREAAVPLGQSPVSAQWTAPSGGRKGR